MPILALESIPAEIGKSSNIGLGGERNHHLLGTQDLGCFRHAHPRVPCGVGNEVRISIQGGIGLPPHAFTFPADAPETAARVKTIVGTAVARPCSSIGGQQEPGANAVGRPNASVITGPAGHLPKVHPGR